MSAKVMFYFENTKNVVLFLQKNVFYLPQPPFIGTSSL